MLRIKLFGKLCMLIVGVVFFVSIALFFGVHHVVSSSLDTQAEQDLQQNQKAFESYLESIKDIVKTNIKFLQDELDASEIMAINEINTEGISSDSAGSYIPALKSFADNMTDRGNIKLFFMTDKQGNVVARGHDDEHGDSIDGMNVFQKAIQGELASGIERTPKDGLSYLAAAPIKDNGGNVIGTILTGSPIASVGLVDELQNLLDVHVTIFDKDTRAATTIMKDGERAIGTSMQNSDVTKTVIDQKDEFTERNNILGTWYDTIYWPIKDMNDNVVGMYFIGQTRSVIETIQSKILNTISMFSVVIGLASLAAGAFFARKFIAPIKKTTQFATSCAEGNLDDSLNISTKDEVEDLANALNYMVHNLKAKINEAEEQQSKAETEMNRARQAAKEAEEAKEQAERAKAEGQQEAVDQLKGIVERVSSASEELSAQVEQASQGTEEQSNRISEAASSIEEMNSTILEVAKNASSAAQMSNSAKDKASEGAEIVQKSVEAINEVSDNTKSMEQNLNDLGERSEQISKVINVIEDIADQTNLLALNAAIEAARAGEAGRGFAVVADEVRKLAEKTMQATKEVNDTIHAIQESANVNIKSMSEAAKKVRSATDLVNQSGSALQEIVSFSEEAANQVQSIATASEEQSSASEEINSRVEDINRISKETAQAMNESARAISELSQQAQQLQGVIDHIQSEKKRSS